MTPRGSGGGNEASTAQLRESMERASQAFTRLSERLETQTAELEGRGARGPGRTDPVMRHWRRWGPLYALMTVWLLMLTLFPTFEPGQQTVEEVGTAQPAQQDTGAGSSGLSPQTGADGRADGAGAADSSSAVDGQGGAPEASSGAGPDGPGGSQQAAGAPQTPGSPEEGGMTRGGFDCEPGARQIPWSQYAAPCVPDQGNENPGETYRGVDGETIRIVRRTFPESAESQAVDQAAQSAGYASSEVNDSVRRVFVDYFNQVYELYGRQVELIEWESQHGNSTDEAQSRGKEGACADADVIVNEIGAYGVLSGSGPFSECAAERGLVVFSGGAYFPEQWYRQYSPYVWNDVPECEKISYHNAEYDGKRLAGRKAKWAGDERLRDEERRFGLLVPNNDEYQHCVDLYERVLEERFGVEIASRYNYTLDISRFPDEGARAAVRFKADDVTTVIFASDPIIPEYVTGSATNQDYFPEWKIIGVAGTDLDTWARTWDQENVSGSLFGLSQLGADETLFHREAERPETYRQATGTEIPDGATGSYYDLINTFNMLQTAGPSLTPQTMAEGVWSLPPAGEPDYASGKWYYQTNPDGSPGRSHTAREDSREIFWMADEEGFDGERGTYVETYDGKRFDLGEWPQEEPPVYP